jgi:hypothetical protein
MKTTTQHPHLAGPRAVFDSSVWLRLCRPGERCPVSGLSRSTLAELVRPCERNGYRPPVESRLLKRKGAARGVLLISKQSLLDYINEQPAPTRADIADATDEALADEARAANTEPTPTRAELTDALATVHAAELATIAARSDLNAGQRAYVETEARRKHAAALRELNESGTLRA